MSKGTAIFFVFLWSLWLLFGYLIFFENPSRIYQIGATTDGLMTLIILLIFWGFFLLAGKVSELNTIISKKNEKLEKPKEQ